MYYVIAHHVAPKQFPWNHIELNYSAIATSLPSPSHGTALAIGESLTIDNGEMTIAGQHETFEDALRQMRDMHRRYSYVGTWPTDCAASGLTQEDIKLVLLPGELEILGPDETLHYLSRFADSAAFVLSSESELHSHAESLYAEGVAGGVGLDPQTVMEALRDWNELWPDTTSGQAR